MFWIKHYLPSSYERYHAYLVLLSLQVGMLHCVEQTKGEGGDNLWVDGFHAANLLYEEDPELFQLLVNTPVKLRNYTSVRLLGTVYSESYNPLIRYSFFPNFPHSQTF